MKSTQLIYQKKQSTNHFFKNHMQTQMLQLNSGVVKLI